MKKILVTGATGFIGGYVIKELLEQNASVIATSSNKAKASVQDWFNSVSYIAFDFNKINDADDYYSYFDKPDAMVHLAWEGLPNYKSSFHMEKNLPRHIAFLKNLIKNGLKDITVTGTCFEYGMQEGILQEDMETIPVTPYGLAKDNLRKNLQELQKEYNFSMKWLRLFYMYGKGQNPNSLLSQLENSLAKGEEVFNMSGGEQVRDFMPVEEAATAIVKVILQNGVTGIINCSSGKPVKVKDFVTSYLEQKNKDIKLNLGHYPYPDFEPMSFWGDNSKLKKIINND
ncbi:MAG TPA: NAD-dependent epimerase/dehydratase family protein [Chitinophagaceae bacterium]|nr:NAD-dependent epimerase/dehydratase family protein [Chitinophagaceae bacterium]